MQVLAGLFGRLVRNTTLLLASLLATSLAPAANGRDDFRILYAEAFTPLAALPSTTAAQKSAALALPSFRRSRILTPVERRR